LTRTEKVPSWKEEGGTRHKGSIASVFECVDEEKVPACMGAWSLGFYLSTGCFEAEVSDRIGKGRLFVSLKKRKGRKEKRLRHRKKRRQNDLPFLSLFFVAVLLLAGLCVFMHEYANTHAAMQ